LRSNQTARFELHDHAVDAWGRDLEEPLHVGLGRRLTVDERVHVDEREVLALLLGEACPCGTGALKKWSGLDTLDGAGPASDEIAAAERAGPDP
jgi:hypothetical protein